jgi:hypothetical protein
MDSPEWFLREADHYFLGLLGMDPGWILHAPDCYFLGMLGMVPGWFLHRTLPGLPASFLFERTFLGSIVPA